MNTHPGKPIQLILVESDEAEAVAIRRACATMGVNGEITHFHNSSEALAALQGQLGSQLLTTRFLILLDIDQPDGLAFLDALRNDANLRRSIVFVISRSADDEDKAAAYDRRVAGYLVKDILDPDYTNLCDLIDVYERSIQFPVA